MRLCGLCHVFRPRRFLIYSDGQPAYNPGVLDAIYYSMCAGLLLRGLTALRVALQAAQSLARGKAPCSGSFEAAAQRAQFYQSITLTDADRLAREGLFEPLTQAGSGFVNR